MQGQHSVRPEDAAKDTNLEPSPSSTSLDITIEKARLRDARAVAAIQRQSFPHRLAYGIGALVTLLWWPGVTFLVARDPVSGQIAGCIIADWNKGSTRVMNLAIHPDWRRRGVGRRLLRTLDEELPDGDLTLMVQEHNVGAQALYASEGFLRAGFARDYYGSGQHGIMMRKPRYPSRPQTTVSVP